MERNWSGLHQSKCTPALWEKSKILKRKIFSVKRPKGHNNDIIITIIAQGKIYKKYQKI